MKTTKWERAPQTPIKSAGVLDLIWASVPLLLLLLGGCAETGSITTGASSDASCTGDEGCPDDHSEFIEPD